MLKFLFNKPILDKINSVVLKQYSENNRQSACNGRLLRPEQLHPSYQGCNCLFFCWQLPCCFSCYAFINGSRSRMCSGAIHTPALWLIVNCFESVFSSKLLWWMCCSMNAPIMVEAEGETDPLQVRSIHALLRSGCHVRSIYSEPFKVFSESTHSTVVLLRAADLVIFPHSLDDDVLWYILAQAIRVFTSGLDNLHFRFANMASSPWKCAYPHALRATHARLEQPKPFVNPCCSVTNSVISTWFADFVSNRSNVGLCSAHITWSSTDQVKVLIPTCTCAVRVTHSRRYRTHAG